MEVTAILMEDPLISVSEDCNCLNESSKTLSFPVDANFTTLLTGTKLMMSQIQAMIIKKFWYQIRNYALLIIQCLVPAFFVVLTMLVESFLTGTQDLPSLDISFDEYLDTVTTIQTSQLTDGSANNLILSSYESILRSLPERHSILSTGNDFVQTILDQHVISTSRVSLNFIIGAAFNDTTITAFFNNQPYHSAPLSLNLVNNAIWQ